MRKFIQGLVPRPAHNAVPSSLSVHANQTERPLYIIIYSKFICDCPGDLGFDSVENKCSTEIQFA